MEPGFPLREFVLEAAFLGKYSHQQDNRGEKQGYLGNQFPYSRENRS